MSGALKLDTASAICKGGRDYQEDALITDFMSGSDVSMAVLADGMGGHAAGDLASKIVVTEVFRELTFKRDAIVDGSARAKDVLEHAAHRANTVLSRVANDRPEQRGMGATLLGLLIRDNMLHWISVGDSPLFLFRNNRLRQLNQDHSLATYIKYLVESGALTEEEGAAHPERNVLTSVLSGAEIAEIDCPATPFALRAGDVLIAASDGLQFLADEEIARVIRELPLGRSSDISDALMSRLTALEDPDLDNVTLLAIQIFDAGPPATLPRPIPKRDVLDAKGQIWPFGRSGKTALVRRGVAMGQK
jgi:serine/threonine protein phosphatase PrpC